MSVRRFRMFRNELAQSLNGLRSIAALSVRDSQRDASRYYLIRRGRKSQGLLQSRDGLGKVLLRSKRPGQIDRPKREVRIGLQHRLVFSARFRKIIFSFVQLS